MRILIAEDDRVSRKLLTSMLAKWGFEIMEAADGLQAMEIMERDDAPEMALLDWVMPKMSGTEITRNIRGLDSETKNTYIIILTSKDDDKNIVHGLQAGADDYITKPFNERVLKARVQVGQRIHQLQMDLADNIRQLKKANKELEKMSLIDTLTGISNRRRFNEKMLSEWKRATRHQSEVSLLMIDIDNFKKYNDGLGHVAGDACLKIVANTIKNCVLRSGDMAARYGGEEFAVILPETDNPGAMTVANTIREAVENKKIEHPNNGNDDFVTISIGVCTFVPQRKQKLDELIQTADKAMYQAKTNGRNQVCNMTDVISQAEDC